MIITDKQELRRCVKQLVRRADVCEAELDFDVQSGPVGVEAALDVWARPASSPSESLQRSCAEQSPFHPDAAAMFAALDAMDLPVKDLDRAASMQRSYEREAYISELLDTMRAKCILVRVPMVNASSMQFHDERFCPLLVVDNDIFAAGRYGVNYEAAARAVVEAASLCDASNIKADTFDVQAMRYCLLPVCQDHGFTLHLTLKTRQEIEEFSILLDCFEGVHAVVSASADVQRALIDAASERIRMLVRTDVSQIPYALCKLGTRFVPFASCASVPELMLGRWLCAKEDIWQTLADAYLPLARSGYELQSAAIERDVRRMLSQNLLAFCRT